MRLVSAVLVLLLCLSFVSAQPHVAVSDLFVGPVAGQPFWFTVSAYSESGEDVDLVLSYPPEGFRVRNADGAQEQTGSLTWSRELVPGDRLSASPRFVPRDTGEYTMTLRAGNEEAEIPISVREPSPYGAIADSFGEDTARYDVGLLRAGARETFVIDKDGIDLTQITFILDSQVSGAAVFVKDRERAPVPFPGEAYGFTELSAPEVDARSVELQMRVPDGWVSDNGPAGDVRLYQLIGDEWRATQTSLVSSHDGHVFRGLAEEFTYVVAGHKDALGGAERPVQQAVEPEQPAEQPAGQPVDPAPEEQEVQDAVQESSPPEDAQQPAQEPAERPEESSPPATESVAASVPWTPILLSLGVVLMLIASIMGWRKWRAEHPHDPDPHKLTPQERYKKEVARAEELVEQGEYDEATEAYLFARDEYDRAETASDKWKQEAYERLTKLHDKLEELEEQQE